MKCNKINKMQWIVRKWNKNKSNKINQHEWNVIKGNLNFFIDLHNN